MEKTPNWGTDILLPRVKCISNVSDGKGERRGEQGLMKFRSVLLNLEPIWDCHASDVHIWHGMRERTLLSLLRSSLNGMGRKLYRMQTK